MKVPQIDLAAVARDRGQLWAEAALAEATGESLVIPEKLWPEATARQLARMEIDPWDDLLGAWLTDFQRRDLKQDGCHGCGADERGNPEWRVFTSYLLTNVLRISIDHQHNNHTKRLTASMRNLGWTHSDKTFRIGSVVGRGYVKPVHATVTGPSARPAVLTSLLDRKPNSDGLLDRRPGVLVPSVGAGTARNNVTGATGMKRRVL